MTLFEFYYLHNSDDFIIFDINSQNLFNSFDELIDFMIKSDFVTILSIGTPKENCIFEFVDIKVCGVAINGSSIQLTINLANKNA